MPAVQGDATSRGSIDPQRLDPMGLAFSILHPLGMSVNEFGDATFASGQGLGCKRFVDKEKALAVGG